MCKFLILISSLLFSWVQCAPVLDISSNSFVLSPDMAEIFELGMPIVEIQDHRGLITAFEQSKLDESIKHLIANNSNFPSGSLKSFFNGKTFSDFDSVKQKVFIKQCSKLFLLSLFLCISAYGCIVNKDNLVQLSYLVTDYFSTLNLTDSRDKLLNLLVDLGLNKTNMIKVLSASFNLWKGLIKFTLLFSVLMLFSKEWTASIRSFVYLYFFILAPFIAPCAICICLYEKVAEGCQLIKSKTSPYYLNVKSYLNSKFGLSVKPKIESESNYRQALHRHELENSEPVYAMLTVLGGLWLIAQATKSQKQ